VKYGQHANDHWPVDEVLALASRERQLVRPPQPVPADNGAQGSDGETA